jgi:molybdate transport system substrate-binding protein
MVAAGDVALGFQQLSELMGLDGIAWALLPEEAQIVTIFSGAVAATSTQQQAVRQLLAAWASPETGEIKAKHGMQPA